MSDWTDLIDYFADSHPYTLESLFTLRNGGAVAATPEGIAATQRLFEYWTHGEGAAKIAWGSPGDFKRCVSHLRKYVTDPEGLCNHLHQRALGAPPGKGH